MAHFLRDEHIRNITINEQDLVNLASLFFERLNLYNTSVAEADADDQKALLFFIIRFDDKGYRVYTIDDLLSYYRIAKSVERIIITIEAFESLRTQRAIGTFLEVRLDEKDPTTSYLTATSDNRDWVDASFSSIQEGLAKFQNKNGWAYSAWTALGGTNFWSHFGVSIESLGCIKNSA
jgi:hypothetical protein